MASREDLLQSIQPGMRVDKDFFMRIYGYELTYPGFAKTALARLESAGCDEIWRYYLVVDGYEQNRDKILKAVSEWYRQQDFYRKKVDGSRGINQGFQSSQKTTFSQKRKESLLKKLKARKK